jgi:hypothetical protein
MARPTGHHASTPRRRRAGALAANDVGSLLIAARHAVADPRSDEEPAGQAG